VEKYEESPSFHIHQRRMRLGLDKKKSNSESYSKSSLQGGFRRILMDIWGSVKWI